MRADMSFRLSQKLPSWIRMLRGRPSSLFFPSRREVNVPRVQLICTEKDLIFSSHLSSCSSSASPVIITLLRRSDCSETVRFSLLLFSLRSSPSSFSIFSTFSLSLFRFSSSFLKASFMAKILLLIGSR